VPTRLGRDIAYFDAAFHAIESRQPRRPRFRIRVNATFSPAPGLLLLRTIPGSEA
jgi:hypothetical protein